MTRGNVVIVGGGLAGLRAAERLRERRFAGFITMIGDEPREPYNRPPMSKQLLTGKMRESDLCFQTFARLSMTLRAGHRAVGLDPARGCLQLDSGDEVPYDGLIVATGVTARRLPTVPAHDERVATLRTLGDFRRLARHLRRARSIAVIGGGFVGCEVAASARALGVRVTIIDLAPVLLHRVLGPQLGAVLTEVHRGGGVDLRLGTGIEQWRTSRAGVSLDLTDGSTVCADVVLVAIGTAPAVEWMANSGADVADGVRCDETSHVIGLDGVVAAGDVARWPNLRFGPEPRRVEHWINAVEHGRAAADSLLDGREHAAPFAPVPRFWSEQHGVRIQSVGMPSIAERVEVVRGSVEERSFVVACMLGRRIVGALGFDSPRAMLEMGEIVDAANPVVMPAPTPTDARLASPRVHHLPPRPVTAPHASAGLARHG
jgi:NADPH-dependent 2,4-dienoyl-CoA reductase/sulfur reductase-like enzyme